jgi:hypothetical protein
VKYCRLRCSNPEPHKLRVRGAPPNLLIARRIDCQRTKGAPVGVPSVFKDSRMDGVDVVYGVELCFE